MILFYEDWSRYPDAIVDISTKNKTFLNLAGIYKKMGIKNHAFLLALHNPALKGVDPRSSKITMVNQLMVQKECIENPWYYFREVAVAPSKAGVGGSPFRANRGNIAMIWLFFNNVMTLLIQPRQTGKSFVCDSLSGGLLNLWCANSSINLLTKDDSLRIATVARVKEIIAEMPPYLKMRTKKDNNNGESIKIGLLNNVYNSYVAQSSKKLAFNAARGLTSPIVHIDEFAYFNNIATTLPAALPATGAAMDEAKLKGVPHGVLLTTTAGWLDSESGKYAYDFYNDCAPWTEGFFDAKNLKELLKIIRSNSGSDDETVLIDMNHRQLGYTDLWLKKKIKAAKAKNEEAETDFLNIWADGSNTSPFSKTLLAKLKAGINEEPNLEITEASYIIRWYTDEDLTNEQMVIGLDTSDAVGKDDIAMTIRRASNGEVLGVSQINETNTIKFAKWLSELMIKFTKSVLIIERRSTGTAIIDYIMQFLSARNINPYTKMFNWIVQDKLINENRFREMLTHGIGEEFQDNHRRETGFATSAFGRAARDKLYGHSMKKSMEFTNSKTYDKKLIGQIMNLTIKNNRIDHKNGKKDDLVISWLLGYWFLEAAKNLEVYGWNTDKVLNEVKYNNVADNSKERGKADKVERDRKQVDFLLGKLKDSKEMFKVNVLVNKILKLKNGLGSDAGMFLKIDNAIKESLLIKEKKEQESILEDIMPDW